MAQMSLRAIGPYPGRTHRFYRGMPPLYPFGHGLSYLRCLTQITAVAPHPARIPSSTARWSDAPMLRRATVAEVTVRVTPIGGALSDQVVLLFARPPRGSDGGAPRQLLVAFTRLARLSPSQKAAEVKLTFSALSLSFAQDDADGTRILPRGTWELWVGPKPLRRDVTTLQL